jgi:hypothetical protein
MIKPTIQSPFYNKAIEDLVHIERQRAAGRFEMNPFRPAPSVRNWTEFALRAVIGLAVANIAAVALLFAR